MFVTNTDIKNYIHSADVEKLPITYEDKMEVELFGNKVLIEKNKWQWHLHLKLTDACNAKCSFCVEQNSKCNEDAKCFVNQVEIMLSEMERAGILYSVSITGGEPLLFKEFTALCKVLKNHKIKFLTINTNGKYLEQNLDLIDGLFDFIDISRHSIQDTQNDFIFHDNMPTINDLKRIKNKLKCTKMRIQCVLCEIETIQDWLDFIETFSFADDLSFRKLMILSRDSGIQYEVNGAFYQEVLDYAFNNFELIEQTIQDYYIYEIWRYRNINITFSYSNMNLLSQVEQVEDEAVCREFIIHPDGTISGSWDKNRKILK